MDRRDEGVSYKIWVHTEMNEPMRSTVTYRAWRSVWVVTFIIGYERQGNWYDTHSNEGVNKRYSQVLITSPLPIMKQNTSRRITDSGSKTVACQMGITMPIYCCKGGRFSSYTTKNLFMLWKLKVSSHRLH